MLAEENFFLKFLIFYMFEENTASQQIFQGLPFLYLFFLMLIIALKRIRMEKLTYHAMGLVISQFKQFPYDEIHRMAFLITIQASRKKPNIFVTFVFLVKKRCQLLLPSYSIEVV